MAKVITGTGLQEFIESGKHETLPNRPEIKPAEKAAPPPEEKAEIASPVIPEAEEGLEPDDIDLTEHVRKKINKKHRQMKEAQEQAADAEIFAKTQFDERRLVEGERDRLKRELDEVKSRAAPQVPEAKKPDKADAKYMVNGQFDWETFSNDQANFAADTKVREYAARQAQEAEAARQAKIEALAKERFDKAKTKHPDFADLAEARSKSGEDQVPMGVIKLIERSPQGAELAYFLLKNPEEAQRLRDIQAEDDGHPERAIAEAGQLLKQFQEPTKTAEVVSLKAPERGGAPPPITPISSNGAGTVQTDPAKMSTKELRAYEMERERHRRERGRR